MLGALMTAPFPSLIISAAGITPLGSFAESQATFLQPDASTIDSVVELLKGRNIGVVAHFYMDVELQGVLTAAMKRWKHIHISDSLVMADRACAMAEAGVDAIVVLGVDFMSENVRAVMDASGHADVPVYRVNAKEIGCSLAESAEGRAYGAWLAKAALVPRSLHVIYINTALDVKGRAHSIVPTITCTSSNVVRTVLQAAAQVPDLSVWYGPDTYMGDNLRSLFTRLSSADPAEVAALHADHTPETIADLLTRFEVFPQGNCVVHHMFGEEVVRRVQTEHPDAYHTAHLEVPGEMFELAAEAARHGRGCVGSTSNILHFIADKLADALTVDAPARLQFVLGTEAGMVTAIVKRVEELLTESGRSDMEVEIIFPVATEAVAIHDDLNLGIVPGVAGGEGCSTAGGCATCPYMKMNSLDALFDVLESVGTGRDLTPLEPKQYTELIGGRTAADIGCEPILHMRHFQRTDALPDALVDAVLRQAGQPAPEPEAPALSARIGMAGSIDRPVVVDGLPSVLVMDPVTTRGSCGDALDVTPPRGTPRTHSDAARVPHAAAFGSTVDLRLLGNARGWSSPAANEKV
jgi:quinolinate synthase